MVDDYQYTDIEVREWLDKLIALDKEKLSLMNFNQNMRMIEPITHHICITMIEVIADLLGLETSVIKVDYDNTFSYKISFKYRGYEFYNYLKEKEYIGDAI